MKHGKSAKTKGSPKKTPSKTGGKAKKTRPGKVSRSRKGASPKRPSSGRARSAVTGKSDGRAGRSAAVTFTNALVGNAFRRAVKKYSTALKRLTD